MTTEDLYDLFEKYENEYLDSDFKGRKDLKAFNILDQLVPGHGDIVVAAEHDEIWLGIDLDKLAQVITEEQVKELITLGVRLDEDNDSLSFFV